MHYIRTMYIYILIYSISSLFYSISIYLILIARIVPTYVCGGVPPKNADECLRWYRWTWEVGFRTLSNIPLFCRGYRNGTRIRGAIMAQPSTRSRRRRVRLLPNTENKCYKIVSKLVLPMSGPLGATHQEGRKRGKVCPKIIHLLSIPVILSYKQPSLFLVA